MGKSFKREIVLDTETTGLLADNGDRIIEIGCIELIDHLPTGRVYHQYINPEFSMSDDVIKIHGLTNEFLSDKPVFSEIAQDFLNFIGLDSVLVAHHASFDIRFLNSELSRLKLPAISNERVIDTLVMAKKQFPNTPLNLDNLCKLLSIDASFDTTSSVLSDSKLVAEVYLKLLEKC